MLWRWQVLDGDGKVRSYSQISQEEVEQIAEMAREKFRRTY